MDRETGSNLPPRLKYHMDERNISFHVNSRYNPGDVDWLLGPDEIKSSMHEDLRSVSWEWVD